MRFAAWPVLILLLLIPLLYRWWRKRNRPPAIRFPLTLPRKASTGNPVSKLLVIRAIALSLFIVAAARPQTTHRQIERKVSGIDIMVVMDLSASMNIEDLGRDSGRRESLSRLAIAKQTIREFIRARQNDRIGLVVFSGEALTMAPPTLDYGLVLKALQDAEIGVLKDGTAIGDGLAVAVSRLKDSKARSRVIILLTDGDNNVGQVDPATAGELAAGFGIRTYTIAIGTEGRVKLPIRHKSPFGKTITTYQWFDNALNPKLLKQIAELTSGKFYRVTDATALDRVFQEIDQLEKSEIKTRERVHYEEWYDRPLKLGLFFLFLEQLLAMGWWRLLV